MKVTFVRHGETDWNSQGKQQGKADIPLNEKGLQQAQKTAELLSNMEFDHVYCSPLMRARQTAQVICEGRKVPITYDERISERDMGEFQGKRWEEFDTRKFWDYNADVHYEKAENIQDFYKRVYDFLDSLKDKEQKDESVLIVSHGGVFAPVSSCSGRSRKEDNLIDNLLANAQAYTFEL